MNIHRRACVELIERGVLPADKIHAALTILQIRPGARSWRTFVDQLLLWLGGLALAFAVLFFVAYNWQDLGRFYKFALVEIFMALAMLTYCLSPGNSIASKVSILVATLFLGVLLALYGQTYQTGADPWNLFFNWALLMLPWAFVGRFSAIWLLWVVLVNISLLLYYKTFGGFFALAFRSEANLLWLLFLFNTFTFIIWQILAASRQWLSECWAIRLLAVSSGLPLTLLVLSAIFHRNESIVSPALVWILWLAAMYLFYSRRKFDLFMLAVCSLSAITVTVSFLAEKMLPGGGAMAFLLLFFVVIALGSGAAIWLKSIHREFLP